MLDLIRMLMPFRRFHIDAAETPEIVIESIRREVRPKPDLVEYFRALWKSPKLGGPVFVGTIDGHTFRIRQVIRGRNSFIPLIWGRIEPNQSGTRINVTMLMHPFVFVFMLFWLGVCGWGFYKNPGEIILLIMFAFGATLAIGCFYWEAAKAERLLLGAVIGSATSSPLPRT
jgi:hypothetical protein